MNKPIRDLLKDFLWSEKSAGIILVFATAISLVLANVWPETYLPFWHSHLDLSFGPIRLDLSVEHWINDGLMAIFFLLIGLEIERELYVGELANFRNALLPIAAALGGMLVPALIYMGINAGTVTADGFGVPMATDIAFALGILSLAGKAVPVSLKIFLTALAIIDDLGAITVIAFFYSSDINTSYLFASLGVFAVLFILGKFRMHYLIVYGLGGILMWYLMLQSGIHSSIAGVLLAFAIPFHKDDEKNPSFRLQHFLHMPVAFIILPVFALANTAILFPEDLFAGFSSRLSLGILAGLLLGKFIGITLFSYIATRTRITSLSADLKWKQIIGVSLLGGIGFTMSMFIANLAFNSPENIVAAKMSILLASTLAAVGGLVVLRSSRQ